MQFVFPHSGTENGKKHNCSQNKPQSPKPNDCVEDLKLYSPLGGTEIFSLEPAYLERGRRWIKILKPYEIKQRFTPNLYQKLLKSSQLSIWERAILKDVDRTFPTYPLFKSPYRGKEYLYNVLKAYSIYDLDVGYSQGLAFLVAFLLIHIQNEEDVFWCLVKLMFAAEYNMRALYKKTDCVILKLLLIYFDQLIREHYPSIFHFMENLGMDASMYASQWFCTLFSYRFSIDFTGAVWDIFFHEGMTCIFRTGLALMKSIEDRVVSLPFEKLIPYLNHLETPSIDVLQHSRKVRVSKDYVRHLMLL